MTRSFVRLWLGMLALVAVQLTLALLHWGLPAPVVALAMCAILIIGPMRIAEAPQLSWVYAMAGLFWLVFMLFGLGTLDPLTRHQAPSAFIAQP